MYPTGWGWLTIGSGLAMLAAFVYWRFRHPGPTCSCFCFRSCNGLPGTSNELHDAQRVFPHPASQEELPRWSFTVRLQWHPYLEQRGIQGQTAAWFGVGYYGGSGFLRGRMVFPIHDE